jgi:TolA-binding protein
MDCPDLSRVDFLEKYLRGELGPAEQDEFEVHILECARCLQALETVQAVRDALSERAHEIRGATPVRRVGLRWAWVAVMSVLVAAGGMGLYRYGQRSRTDISQRQTPAPSKPTLPVESAKETTATSVPTSEALPRPQHPKPQARETASHTPVASTLTTSSQQAKKEDIAVPAVIPTPSASGKDAGIATAGIQSQMTPVPELASNESADEVAKELFRLGVVQAPPYTFSGFAGSSKTSNSQKTHAARDAGLGAAVSTGAAGKTPAAEPARAQFQNAMDAYLEKRYAAAAALLEEAVSVEPNAADANFFLGICRLLEAKPADAIPPLNATVTNERSPYTQAAHFYLAKAYVQTGNLSQAEAELRTAADMPGRLTGQASSMLVRVQAVRVRQKAQHQNEERK